MTKEQFKARTKALAVEILKLCDQMPSGVSGHVVSKQLARSGTSIAANYRAACRARSRAECIAKMGIVEEEADETCLWLEISQEVGLVPPERTAAALQETNELLSMTIASIRTMKRKAREASRAR